MSAPVVPKLYLVLLLNSFLPVICSLALASAENGISPSTTLPIQEDLKSHLPQDMPLLTPGANNVSCVGHCGGPCTSNPVFSVFYISVVAPSTGEGQVATYSILFTSKFWVMAIFIFLFSFGLGCLAPIPSCLLLLL